MSESRRAERVAQSMREHLAQYLSKGLGLADLGYVTITDVVASPDLRHAKIYVSVFGDQVSAERSLKLLQGQSYQLRLMLGRDLRMKYVPDLHFLFDDSFEQGQRIEKLLKTASVASDQLAVGEEPTDSAQLTNSEFLNIVSAEKMSPWEMPPPISDRKIPGRRSLKKRVSSQSRSRSVQRKKKK